MTKEITNEELFKLAVKAIKSRFALLELRLEKDFTLPTQEGLEAIIKLTEMDLKVLEEAMHSTLEGNK